LLSLSALTHAFKWLVNQVKGVVVRNQSSNCTARYQLISGKL